MERIIEEVVRRIKEITLEKVLFIIRKNDRSNYEIITETIKVLEERGYFIHIVFEDDDDFNLYKPLKGNIKKIDYPNTIDEIEELFDAVDYEFALINYIKLVEGNKLNNLDIDKGFESILFQLAYRGLKIYTRIYEFVGECRNNTLRSKIYKYLEGLNILNINTFGTNLQIEDYSSKDTLNIFDKKILALKDVYKSELEEIVINKDTIITGSAYDYIKENNIMVRRR